MNSIVPSNSDPRQLSIFEPQFNDRIRRTNHEGVEYFSLVDMMAEFSETKQQARNYWKDTKDRLKADGFQLLENIRQLKMKAPDGKMRLTDCADGPTCLRIIQSIPSPKAEPIRMWLASLGYERLEEVRNPGLGTQRAKERDLRLLKAQGYSNKEALAKLQGRVDNMAGFKSLMENVQSVCDKPRYGDIVNAEYMAMFGEIASGLRTILETDSIRDKLPKLQLSYLTTAEFSIEAVLKIKDRITMDELLVIIDETVRPLGAMLKRICDIQGVDHITGRPLLKDGK